MKTAPQSPLSQKSKANCRWDMVSLGEVRLRLDPGAPAFRQSGSFESGKAAATITSPGDDCYGVNKTVATKEPPKY